MADPRYHYDALVTDVYDGDTITVDVDLGFGIWMKEQKLRLYGIDTPEVRGEEREEGLIARDYLRDRILGSWVFIKTLKDKKGKYGRWLARVFVDGEDINRELVNMGYAAEADY